MLNMQARHRSPANGYRSGSLGLGLDVPSIGGYGFYNSDNRSRPGFGRGHPHPRSSQPPTPRKVDIFMEAGRLAAEYMVSHGLLPAAILSSKWQNGVLKEFRSAEGGNMESRASALSRLGSSTSDLGFGRKRYHDELDKRNHPKVRKTVAPYNNYESDLGRDYGRSRSWSCRDRSEFVMEGDDDDDNVSERHREEEQVSKDVGNWLPGSSSVQPLPKGNKFGDVESGQVKHSILDDTDIKGTTSTVVVSEVLRENGWQTSKVDSEETNLTTVIDEMKNVARQDESKIHVSPIDSPIQQCLPSEDSSSNNTNLLAFCKFAKVPTKARSSLTHRNKKLGHAPDKEGKTSTIGAIVRSEVLVNDNINDDPSVRMPSNKLRNSKDSVSETSKEFFLQFVVEDAKNSCPVHGVEEDTCTGPPSLPDKRFMYTSDREAGQGMPIVEKPGTLDKERGEKRACEVGDMSEGQKKAKESLSSVVSEVDECFHLSSLNNNTSTFQKETTLPKEKITLANAESCMGNGSQFPDSEAFVEYSQEKQLNPSSFKTCDLNLMEVSDVTENHHQGDTILMYPSIPETNRETVDLDVDVAISDSNLCSDYGMQVNDIKEIEVIDLEKDSASGDKTFDNIHEKMNNEFPGLEGFSSNAPNADDIPDVHDNYDGLMLSEYLSTFPNCTSIANVVSPMQTETGLNDDEGTLVDDDSIYTSLGEIPLSFMRAWEQQPPQKY